MLVPSVELCTFFGILFCLKMLVPFYTAMFYSALLWLVFLVRPCSIFSGLHAWHYSALSVMFYGYELVISYGITLFKK